MSAGDDDVGLRRCAGDGRAARAGRVAALPRERVRDRRRPGPGAERRPSASRPSTASPGDRRRRHVRGQLPWTARRRPVRQHRRDGDAAPATSRALDSEQSVDPCRKRFGSAGWAPTWSTPFVTVALRHASPPLARADALGPSIRAFAVSPARLRPASCGGRPPAGRTLAAVPGSRRRREVQMERVLGTPALFATAYGNVGSSIYYALGLTAVYALGLTPLVFVLAGIVFAATAATYAEGTVRFPEAGGSSSFARHAFDELVSFGAAWAQMLVYVVTIATSAFFVPHYLSIFWEPLNTNPWDIVGGAIVIVVLVALNMVGVQEAAKLSISARGDRLRDAGAARAPRLRARVQPRDPRRQHPLGRRRRRGATSRSRSRSRCSPTRAWRRSRTSPRRRASPSGPCRTPTSSSRVAVFAIYFTLPADRALGAAGDGDRRRADDAARASARGGRLRERPDPRRRREPRASRAACSTCSRSTSACSRRRSSSSRRTRG